MLRDSGGCEDISVRHSFAECPCRAEMTSVGSDPRTRSALHRKEEANDSHWGSLHSSQTRLLVPSAPIEFGLQRALVRALVHDPRDASWNRSAGEDKGSGGHEVQPCAMPGLLRISLVAHSDGHLPVVEA